MPNTKSAIEDQPTDPIYVSVRLDAHADAIRRLGKRAFRDVVEIGARLAECKKLCGHGNWLPWLDREFGWDERTAQRFISTSEFAQQSFKSDNLSDLSIGISSLYLLAAPSTPAEAREEVLDRAANGEALTHAQVKEIVDKAVAESRGDIDEQLATARAEAERREAAVRAEYAADGKILVSPEELQRQIDQVVAPLRARAEKLEAKIERDKKREQERINEDRAARSKGTKKADGIDSQLSLNDTAIRSALRDFVAASLKIKPSEAIKVSTQSAKATEQTLKQWLGDTPRDVRTAISWLTKYLELAPADRDDIGPSSLSELDRLRARIGELEREVRRRDLKIAALEKELAEVKVTTPDHAIFQQADPANVTPEQRWQWSGHFAGDAIAMRAFWIREFGEWETFAVSPSLIALAEQAAESWQQLLAELKQRKTAADGVAPSPPPPPAPAEVAGDDLAIPDFLKRAAP